VLLLSAKRFGEPAGSSGSCNCATVELVVPESLPGTLTRQEWRLLLTAA